MIYGAMIGDIAGSRFEFNNYRKKDFNMFDERCFFTDDTIMTLAVAVALKEYLMDRKQSLSGLAIYWMQRLGMGYPHCGYGIRFYKWMYTENPEPYFSFGNGSAMRVSACGFLGKR